MHTIVTSDYEYDLNKLYQEPFQEPFYNGDITVGTLANLELKNVTNHAAAYRNLIRDYVIPIWQLGIDNDYPNVWFNVSTALSVLALGLSIGKKTKYNVDLAFLQKVAIERAISQFKPIEEFQAGNGIDIN